MLALIGQNLRAWHLWVGLTAIVALDLSMLLVTVPRLAEFSGGLTMLDLRLGGYSATQAAAYIQALGADGRAYYAGAHFTVDTVFAVVEAAVLAMLIIWFTRPRATYAIPLPGALRWFAVALPLAAGGMDIRENLLVRALMSDAAAALDPALVQAASLATQAKWVLAAASILTVIALAAASALSAKRNARSEPRA
jgi:hypothetical protein